MTCECCGGTTALTPTSLGALLIPGIRQRLFRYGSMKDVFFEEDPVAFKVFVTYTLITGETNTVVIPYAWIEREEYGRILSHITKDLG
jgi:hypothetical protein